MNGRELLKQAIQCETVSRIPWVPFVGVHAAKLIDKSADEFLKSSALIVEGVNEAVQSYNPDGIPVVFDLQVEAEALGCKLNWSKENPPAVISHPLSEGTTLDELSVPKVDDGRIGLIMDAAKKLREKHSDIALYGLITGPFTLAMHLQGTDMFMKMMESPEEVHELMKFSTDVAIFMAEEYIKAGCDVIALVDPMTSQIDPASFESFVLPYAIEVFEEIRTKGALSSFFVCGNAQQNIEVMCRCKSDNISIDENIPLDYVRDIALPANVSFGGNIKLTVVLLMGDENDSMMDALECMDIGGKKGFVLAPGCDLAMATPPENLKAITTLVHDEALQGELRASGVSGKEIELIDLTDHWEKGKVVVDVVTLDSSSCAPCQYMVNAVERAAENFDGKVIVNEHRIKEKEGVQMMASLGVQKIPTIVMNGNVEFSSQIPPVHEIRKKIQQYLD